MRWTRWLRLVSACALAMLAAACGTVRPANVDPQCRALGNELQSAVERQTVDEIFEAGVAAGCWTRSGATR